MQEKEKRNTNTKILPRNDHLWPTGSVWWRLYLQRPWPLPESLDSDVLTPARQPDSGIIILASKTKFGIENETWTEKQNIGIDTLGKDFIGTKTFNWK